MLNNAKCNNNKDLREAKKTSYRPAYRNVKKVNEEELSEQLSEIATVWPDLPQHIRQAIITLVKGTK